MSKKILFTSVCQPLGPAYGDGPSVGYELLHGQVTRAQGLFSPRALHMHFSLEYIAENLDTPAVVLQYPTKRALIQELKKGYDFVGVSFLLAVFHRLKDVVALIRKYAPQSKIILGGYGTVLSDEILEPYGDYICREEGVAYIRKLLGEPEIPLPYKHPLLISQLKVFSKHVSNTGMIFAGLGCPNGCDFCCTSYFFKRRHIRLLPTGQDIYSVIERYHDRDPNMPFVILDEDFLLNKKRAQEFRECVLKAGKAVSLFVFSSIKAISQYTVEEILEMGIDGFWIGYEGTRSNFGKQQGRPAEEIFNEFRQHGITILASMIVGFPYQTAEIVQEELDGLMNLKPTLGQFLIYGPTPGTPFYERIMKEGLLHQDLTEDRERYYRRCTGFSAMVKHPNAPREEIERWQQHCFKEDFERLGPSIYRFIETYFLGYQTLKESMNPFLRKKAAWYAAEIRKAYPIFLAGRIFAPNPHIREWIAGLEKEIYKVLGPPQFSEKLMSGAAVMAAFWTGFTLKFNLFQHPPRIRHTYRIPTASQKLHRAWRRLARTKIPMFVELRPQNVVWVRPATVFSRKQAGQLGQQLKLALQKTKNQLVLDLSDWAPVDIDIARQLSFHLRECAQRIRLIIPADQSNHPALTPLTELGLY